MIIRTELAIVVLLTHCFQLVVSIDCRCINDCFSCSASMDGLLPCQWCISTSRCGNSLQQFECSGLMRVETPYNCPMSPRNELAYVDVFARTRALPFIAAANSKTPEMLTTCLANSIPGVVVLRSYEVPCDPICNFCLAYLAYSPNDNAIVLTFRSTNADQQLLWEALNFLLYAQKEFRPVGGKVVAYFHDAFYALWNSGLERGSLASLASAFIVGMRLVDGSRLKFLSFGQPRTGNAVYAMLFDTLIPYKYRVINQGDFITKTPIRLPFLNQDSFTHHRFEVFYPNGMSASDGYIVCPRSEDPVCSESSKELDPATHRHYFNVSLSDYPKFGCIPIPTFYHNLYPISPQNVK
ncbi:Lipase-3 domain-containing protein [Aphelenchoides besseyi]|nr:Lipase-3 domain-containing protein [Aphelenchoides besseyi]